MKFLGIFVVSIMLFIVFSIVQLNSISDNIVSQNAAIVGTLADKHPELEVDIMNALKESAKTDDINKGKEILAKYGHRQGMSFVYQASTNQVYGRFLVQGGTILTIIFLLIFIIVWRGYKVVYSKVAFAAKIAEKVVDGDFKEVLPENGEGYFSVFGYHFNQMSNRLRLSIDKLKEEKIFLKNLISDISHQLKTPVSTLVIANDLMLNDAEMLQEDRLCFLERNRKQLERIEWLIKSLLKLAMLESGMVAFKKVKVLLYKCSKEAILAVQPMADKKQITIETQGDIDKTWFVGDENWTTEAILNILKNSVEHTPKGGKIIVTFENTQLTSKIRIVDNGEGIDKQDLPKIFQRFYRCIRTSKTGSVGIGLALTKFIVDMQDGNISVKSEKNKGSQFIITFLKNN